MLEAITFVIMGVFCYLVVEIEDDHLRIHPYTVSFLYGLCLWGGLIMIHSILLPMHPIDLLIGLVTWVVIFVLQAGNVVLYVRKRSEAIKAMRTSGYMMLCAWVIIYIEFFRG